MSALLSVQQSLATLRGLRALRPCGYGPGSGFGEALADARRKFVADVRALRIEQGSGDAKSSCAACGRAAHRSSMRHHSESGEWFCSRCCEQTERESGNGQTMAEWSRSMRVRS